MKKHSLVIKLPALQQPWKLENLGSGAVHQVCITGEAEKESQDSCCLIFGKAVLILRTLFLVVVDFVLYQAHYLAAKGPNLKKETIYTFYKQTLVGCSLEVSEDTILVASVPRLPLGRNRLLFKMSKRKFLRASIQFCFSLLQ